MREGSRFVIAERAANPVADIDAANGPAACATLPTLTCNKDATINDLSHILPPRNAFARILSAGGGRPRNRQLSVRSDHPQATSGLAFTLRSYILCGTK